MPSSEMSPRRALSIYSYSTVHEFLFSKFLLIMHITLLKTICHFPWFKKWCFSLLNLNFSLLFWSWTYISCAYWPFVVLFGEWEDFSCHFRVGHFQAVGFVGLKSSVSHTLFLLKHNFKFTVFPNQPLAQHLPRRWNML